RLPDAARGARLHPRGDPHHCLEVRPRPGHQHRAGLRRLFASQAQPARFTCSDRDRALSRLQAERAIVRAAWSGFGLRGRLTLLIGALVLIAFGVVFVFVRAEMADESHVIKREEAREQRSGSEAERGERQTIAPISDAQEEVEKTFLIVGGIALVTA